MEAYAFDISELPAALASERALIACLCAEWCGTCKEFEPRFAAMATRFPEAVFVWLDVEDDAELCGDIDVENFPTLLIDVPTGASFFGTVLPHAAHLERLIASTLAARASTQLAIPALRAALSESRS